MCEEEATRRGLTLLPAVRDPARSAKSLARPHLLGALKRLAAGEAGAIIVKDLERLTRDVGDLARLLDWFDEAGATLVIVDFPPMDPLSPEGRQYAQTSMTWLQNERQRNAARTSQALRSKQSRGGIIGRPPVPPDVAQRIRTMFHEQRMSTPAICTQLNDERVPTARGGTCWRPSALQTVLDYKRPTRRRHVELPTPPKRKRKPSR
jgi:DNA invertase Pin-like site-specific DNA recombinase